MYHIDRLSSYICCCVYDSSISLFNILHINPKHDLHDMIFYFNKSAIFCYVDAWYYW